MSLPGTNTITLSFHALGAMVEAELNKGRSGEPRVRVTDVNRPSSFKDEIEFQITTDAPKPDSSSVFVRPDVPLPEPDAPVMLPASVDGIPL